MKLLIFTFTIVLIFACSQKTTDLVEPNTASQTVPIEQNVKTIVEKPLEKIPNSANKIKLPLIKDFGITDLRRLSENKAEGGLLLPPFDYAEIAMTNFNEVKAGENIQLFL